MATELVMPKLSDTMKEGSIVRWLKKEGDAVRAGEVIAEIQSDKATIEFEAYSDGVLRKTFVEPDQAVPVGEKIALMTDEGEEVPSEGEVEKKAAPKETEKKPEKEEKEKPAEEPAAKPPAKKPPTKQPKTPALREPPADEKAEAEEAEEEAPRTEAAAEAGAQGKESRAAAIGRMKPAEGLARVKFGGRGPQTGLSKASAAKVIAAARSRSDRKKQE